MNRRIISAKESIDWTFNFYRDRASEVLIEDCTGTKKSGKRYSMYKETEYEVSESITIGGPPSLAEKQTHWPGYLPCKRRRSFANK